MDPFVHLHGSSDSNAKSLAGCWDRGGSKNPKRGCGVEPTGPQGTKASPITNNGNDAQNSMPEILWQQSAH